MKKLCREKPVKVTVLLPPATVKKLEALQKVGLTASGYIRNLIEVDLEKRGSKKP